LLTLLLPPSPAPVRGHVVRVVHGDSVAVPGAQVILHHVTVAAQGPVDSARSATDGGFELRHPVDTAGAYLVSARYSGIEYFSAPFALADGLPTVTVVVVDTSSTQPITLAARHLIISPPAPDGTRAVVDLSMVDNTGPFTRVSLDSLHPSWTLRVPRYAIEMHGGESDFSLEAFHVMGDSIALLASIPPGQRRIELDYQIPPNSPRFEIAIDHPAPLSNIISADPTLRVLGHFTRADTSIGGKPYTRWEGRLQAGQPVVLAFGSAPTPSWVLPSLIGAMAIALVLAATHAFTRGR
jgi:hypothetical protein